MVQFNFAEKTIKAKVVFYGPAKSGKTTNLEQIHRLTDPSGHNSLVSLNTAQDRTLFFDLLPISLGQVSGYEFKIQVYTVPGQVQYNATRRVVLAGADAIVFVADSRKSMAKENIAAFENMKVNLLANRLVPEKVPLVLQYNKRDMPDIDTEAELNRQLNAWGRKAFLGVAANGEGVLETFGAAAQEMLQSIAIKYNLKDKGLDPAAVPELVSAALRALAGKAEDAAREGPEAGAREGRLDLAVQDHGHPGAKRGPECVPCRAAPMEGAWSSRNCSARPSSRTSTWPRFCRAWCRRLTAASPPSSRRPTWLSFIRKTSSAMPRSPRSSAKPT